MPLIDVSGRLTSPEIERIIAPFRERRASIRRLIVVTAITVWVALWMAKGEHFLSAEATKVMPFAVLMLAASALWAVMMARGVGKHSQWPDVAGTLGDFIGIAVLLSQAWNLMLPLVGALPLACVTTGARFKKPAFQIALVAACAIVLVSAPSGYWDSRPAVAALALMLIAGIPVTFNRVLNGLWHVSEQAIDAKDAQARFLAMMSHELRTPLNTVIHAAQLVGAYPDEAEQAHLRNSIITNANVLLGRVNDVLDVATAESKESEIASLVFDLRSLMATVEAVVKPAAEEKQIMLSFIYDTSQATVLRGDARRIEQVVTNLTSNAVKYTETGGAVSVTAHAAAILKGATTVDLIFTVSDTGIGIPDAYKARIFEPFQQVSTGDTRQHGGVGLGLHIVKLISERLNGKLSVQDNAGGGTIFTWVLPIEPAEKDAKAISHVPTLELIAAHKAKANPLKCLVVDDNLSNRDIMGRILTLSGHEADFAVDGEQSLVRMAASEYDIVFLDLHMPGMSGIDVLRSLRTRYAGHTPKIVMLTASTDHRSSQDAIAEGAIGVLTKPLSLPVLIETMERIQQGDTIRKRGAPDQNNPLLTMRRLTDATAVRAFLHTSVSEVRTALDALLELKAQDDHDVQHYDLAIHRLKNALINAGVDHETLQGAGFNEKYDNAPSVHAIRHEFERLSMVTIAALQLEPEFT